MVDLRAGYEREIRLLGEHWHERLEVQRERADKAAADGEARRIDALLVANANNVALALSKQEAQALAQDRRIAVLEQNQYQSGGKDLQRVEQRGDSRFTITQLIALAGIAALVLLDLHSRGQF